MSEIATSHTDHALSGNGSFLGPAGDGSFSASPECLGVVRGVAVPHRYLCHSLKGAVLISLSFLAAVPTISRTRVGSFRFNQYKAPRSLICKSRGQSPMITNKAIVGVVLNAPVTLIKTFLCAILSCRLILPLVARCAQTPAAYPTIEIKRAL